MAHVSNVYSYVFGSKEPSSEPKKHKSGKKEMNTKRKQVSNRKSTSDKIVASNGKRVRVQEIADFFDVNLPKTHPVDSMFVSGLTLKELRVDVDNFEEYLDPDERVIPWYKHKESIKDELYENIDKMGELKERMQEELNASLRGNIKNIANESVPTPIFLPTGHEHKEVRASLIIQLQKPLSQIKREYFEDPYWFLSDNERYHIFQSKKYTAFENFIQPRILVNELNNHECILTGTIKEIDSMISSKTGIRMDGVERIELPTNPKKAKTEKKIIFAISYPVDDRCLFYVTVIFNLNGAIPKELKECPYYKTKYTLNKKERDYVLDIQVQYLGHFYFTCVCRRQKQ